MGAVCESSSLDGEYTVRQNALLSFRWCNAEEPSSETLARGCFVDPRKLEKGWLRRVRAVVSEQQALVNSTAQLGGPGIEVQIAEVTRAL